MIKKILSLSIVMLCCFTALGQVTKFRTQQIALKLIEEDGNWSEWSDWEDSNSLVSYNSDIERITIHGEPNRTFDIISTEEKTDSDGDQVLIMKCIGADENECIFKMVYDQDLNLQFYIYYDAAIVVYNVIKLD